MPPLSAMFSFKVLLPFIWKETNTLLSWKRGGGGGGGGGGGPSEFYSLFQLTFFPKTVYLEYCFNKQSILVMKPYVERGDHQLLKFPSLSNKRPEKKYINNKNKNKNDRQNFMKNETSLAF